MPWLTILIALGTFVGGVGTIWGTMVLPERREHERREGERLREESAREDAEARRRADHLAFLDGVPEIDGVTDGAQSAPKRLKAVETAVRGVVKGQALLEKRMDEANGTAKRTEGKVDELLTHWATVKPALDRVMKS